MGRSNSRKKTAKPGGKDKGTSLKVSAGIPSLLMEAALSGDLDTVSAELSGPAEAAALIDILSRAPEPPVNLMQRVAGLFPDKRVEKAFKRALFVLKKKGIRVDEIEPPGEVTAEKVHSFSRTEQTEAHVGPFDAEWFRPVLMMIPRPSQGVDLVIGIISDEEGIGEFHFGPRSRKEARGIREMFSEKAQGLVPASAAHAAALFEEAYMRHGKTGRPVPPGFLEARSRMRQAAGPGDGFSGPRQEKSSSPITVEMAAKLLSHPLMAPWRLSASDAGPFADAFEKVKSSPLILSEAQKRDRVMSLVKPHFEAVFSSESIGRFVRRLEETAYLFAGRGEDEYGKLCAAILSSLEDPGGGFMNNPFLSLLIERSLSGDAARDRPGAQLHRAKEGDRPLILL